MTVDLPSSAAERRERDRRRREDDLLAAAEVCFSAQGFHVTSMEDIARRAGYAVGALYRYFPSKEALYWELLYRKGVALVEAMEAEAAQQTTACDRIRAYFDAKLRFFDSNRHFLEVYDQLIASEPTPDSPALRVFDLQQRASALLQQWVADGVALQQFPPTDPGLFVAAIKGLTDEVMREGLRRQLPLETLSAYIRQAVLGLLYGPAQPMCPQAQLLPALA